MKGLLILMAVVSALVYGCNFSDYGKEMQLQRASTEAARLKQIEANKVPRIVSRTNDGCAVYAFNPDDYRWRYFTRCGSEVTTDNSYTYQQRSGKTVTTVSVPDTIKTEQR